MRSRTVGIVLAALGALCLVAAAILAWVVAPSRAKLPSDLDVARQYSGTARIALNPAGLATGDLQRALILNKPATVDRTVKVQATDGNAAQVQDSRTISVEGTQVGGSSVAYAVDRKSLEAVEDPPDGWTVTPAQGLTISFPIGTEQQDYTGWVNDTQSTTPVKYVKEEEHAGVDTYVFQSDSAAAPIKDQQTLAALPKEIPASTLSQLVAGLPLPAELTAMLGALPNSSQPLPLSYTYEQHSTYWVEPTTGSVIDVERQEVRKAGLQLPTGAAVPALLPIYDVTTKGTEASVATAADEAQDKKNSLTAVRRTWPLVLLVLGIVLLGAGLVLALRKPAETLPPPTAQPPTVPPSAVPPQT